MRRILFVSKVPPYPTTVGGNQRSNYLYRALSRVGKVDMILFQNPRTVSEDMRRVFVECYGVIGILPFPRRGRCVPWRFVRPLAPGVIDRLAHNLGRRRLDYEPDPAVARWVRGHVSLEEYDVIVGRFLYSLTKPDLLKARPVVLDVDDLDTEVYRSRLNVPTNRWWENVVIRSHLRQLEKIVPRKLSCCDHLWVANPKDRDLKGLQYATVLPNLPFFSDDDSARHSLPPQPENNHVVTVASFSHPPNFQGVDYFVSSVWPRVRKVVPKAVYRIVGSRMGDDQKRRWEQVDGVEAVGFVDNLRNVYLDSAFSVAPIYSGGGTNIKVLESLAYGRTCVVTPSALRGYEAHLHPDRDLLVGHDARQLADCCIKLLMDPGLCHRLASRGAEVVQREYSFDRFCKVVHDTLEVVLETKSQTASERLRSAQATP